MTVSIDSYKKDLSRAQGRAQGWESDYNSMREVANKYQTALEKIREMLFVSPGAQIPEVMEEVKKLTDDRKRLSKLFADLRGRVEDFYQLAVRNEKSKQA